MEQQRLIKMNQKYHLQISEKLEKKIRVLCNKFPTTEWSGVLFYTYEGSFQDNIVFTAEDLLFKDLGDTTSTEFYLDDGNTAEYIANHELWDCQCGILHSHHNMQAFFSGQDNAMLRQEGLSQNHFLSLVVNNAGEYVAAITVKETIKRKIVEDINYKTFNDVKIQLPTKSEEEEETVVNIYPLEIAMPTKVLCDDYDELMSYIEESKKIKEERGEKEKEERTFNRSPFAQEFLRPFYNEFKDSKGADCRTEIEKKVSIKVEECVAKLLKLSLTDTKLDKEFLDDIETIFDNSFGGISTYESALDDVGTYILADIYETITDFYTEDDFNHFRDKIVDYIENLKLDNRYIKVLIEFIEDY